MLKLSDEEFRQVQLTELELLKEADRICRKYDINYVIIAGTLLGAVRHKGFIPWDDDADIAMTRKDYDRFKKACRAELSGSDYYFQDDETCSGYHWGYGKLRRKDSIFRRAGQEDMPYPQGICIDVFPLDGIPDSLAGRLWRNLQCFFIRKTLWSYTGKNTEKNIIKRSAYKYLSLIPQQKALGWFRSLAARGDESSRYVRILLFPAGNRKFGYERKWYMSASDMEFEGHTFKGIAQWEDYLSFKFGDYIKYPSKEERIKKQHPVTALKFPGGEIRLEETAFDAAGGKIPFI